MDHPHASGPRERHVVVAGTGRSGTSVLVDFFRECGLDTGDRTTHHSPAGPRSGNERRLCDNASYVVKDPSFARYCHSIDLSAVQIDAVVVPVRDLAAAASSRVLQERLDAMLGSRRAPADRYDTVGITPGGVEFSCTLVDQARVLAVNFYEIIEWTVRNEIPLVMLAFPRLVDDGEYAVSELWPVLERFCTREDAIIAHKVVFDPDAVRVREKQSLRSSLDEDVDREALVAYATAMGDKALQLEVALNQRTKRLRTLEAQLPRTD